MKNPIMKLSLRSIRSFYGRYIALLLIVLLSVGFFAGLKVTKKAMANAAEQYWIQQHFHDFQLLSTLGFSKEDVESVSELPGILKAEGGNCMDVLLEKEDAASPFRLIMLPESVDLPSLTAGRMPAADNECLADAKAFREEDIGTTLFLSEENGAAVKEQLAAEEFVIVGLADSPLYISVERGTAGIGTGALTGFLYVPAGNFAEEVYSEINLLLEESAPAYSKEYDALAKKHKDEIANEAERLAKKRYDEILAGNGLEPEAAAQAGFFAPETYVLGRAENAGYASFENDTSIVSGVANIFPVFFILIAMLVCITTMSRMVDEERTQIGVLKAMGFSGGAITAKYLTYAGSATVIGWVFGFFLGTWGLPQVFWFAYRVLYDFAPLPYLFEPYLAAFTLAAALIGIIGSTWFSCRKELGCVPAGLIRPRSAKTGKRILLERAAFLWKRLPFLQKVAIRNMFRYKKRLIMMLVGISCCAGLVVTAFGVRDSMIDIARMQFEEIQVYDMEAAFSSGQESALREELEKMEEVSAYRIGSAQRVDLSDISRENSLNTVCLYGFLDDKDLIEFWNLRNKDGAVAFPGKGEAAVNLKVAKKLGLSVGDSFEIRDSGRQSVTLKVGGIFENYIDNYIIISAETYADAFGEWKPNAALIVAEKDTQALAEELLKLPGVTSITQLAAARNTADSALSCLDYIIWLVVLFAGGLAFIVIFNLTNINIAERSREIATVQVLGFYPGETESYVLWENMLLSILASFIGLPLGSLFHYIVMNMVVVDSMYFPIFVTAASYGASLLCTVSFAVIVNLFMKRHIDRIPMAESLKAVE